MKSNYTLVHIWDIPIRINISLIVFLPILAWLIGSGEQLAAYASIINAMTPATVDAAALDGPADRWIIGIAAAVGLFASVTFHELGHSWMAKRYDIEVESITLWLLGGLASLAVMPKEWKQEFWIAVAGPISSILLGVIFIAALAFVPGELTVVVFVLGFLAVMNIILAAFNMLPAFPMDGGRVLRSLLARNRPYVSATRTAAKVGTGFALLFLLFGTIVVFSPILILLAVFIYVAATSESRAVVLDTLLSGLTVEDLRSTAEPIAADAPLASLFDAFFRSRRSELPVVDAAGNVVGIVTADAMKRIDFDELRQTGRLDETVLEATDSDDGSDGTVATLASADYPHFDSRMSAFDALMELMKGRTDVAIVESDGMPIGVVSRSDFATALDVRRDFEPF